MQWHPKNWPVGLAVAILYPITYLPYRVQMALGRGLGRLGECFAKRRASIVDINLKLAFSHLTDSERLSLRHKVFASAGMGVFEMLIAWLVPAKRFERMVHFEIKGLEHLEAARASGKGILMFGAHFTCLEIVGRLFATRYPVHLVYRKHESSAFEAIMTGSRGKYAQSCISRANLKGMIRCLKSGQILWYAPDQDFGHERSVFVPFMNVATATLKATAWLTQAGNAVALPGFFYRRSDGRGYVLEFQPLLENYPSGDEAADARRYNALLEPYVKAYPDQYLWQHRRFKTRPLGEPKLY